MKPSHLLTVLLLLTSCVSNRTKDALDRAEALMEEVPDSALAMITAIPQDALTPRSIRARHALLTTMAQDKCYMDVVEDSTIRIAYDWYQRHGTTLERLRAAYYWAVVQQNTENDIEAAISFSDAESLAESLEEYRWQSLCNQHLSDIFSRNYDRVRAMDCARKSLEEAELSKDALMADYCRLDIATQYLAQARGDSAKELLTKVVEKYDENTALYSYASRLLAKLYLFGQEVDYEKAGSLYDVILEKETISLNCQDFGNLGLIAQHRGDVGRSEYYCSLAEQTIHSPVDSTSFYTILSHVYDLRGDDKKSYEFFSKAMEIQDRVVYAQLEQSVTHALENYYLSQADLEKAKSRSRLSFSLLIGSLLVGIIIWLIARLRRAKLVIVEKMAQIQDFSRDFETLQSKNSVTQGLLDIYTRDKIKSLNSLADAYFSWDSESIRQKEKRIGDQTKEELVETFQKQLERFRKNADFYTSLENALNVSHNDIMVRAREELKQEKKIDIDLVILYFCGFSAKSICFLKDLTEASVRMRKTRLKQFFDTLPDHRGDEFVRILERKE